MRLIMHTGISHTVTHFHVHPIAEQTNCGSPWLTYNILEK